MSEQRLLHLALRERDLNLILTGLTLVARDSRKNSGLYKNAHAMFIQIVEAENENLLREDREDGKTDVYQLSY